MNLNILDHDDSQPKNVPNNLDNRFYYSHSHTSPYVDGKKNAQYVHPSLTSNQVFYQSDDHKNKPADYKRPSTSANQESNRYATEERYQTQDVRPVTSNQNARVDSRRNDDRNEEVDRYGSRAGARNEHHYYDRDDRSETSTLSSTGYLCPNCLNRHIHEDQRDLCRRQRDEDIDRERRLNDRNTRLTQEEQEQDQFYRNARMNESKGLKEKLDQDYYSRLENRRSPKKEPGSAFDNIFQGQNDLIEKNRAKNQDFRSSLQDQIRQSSWKKSQQKEANLSPYETSLQIGEGYHNKYVEGASGNIKRTLKDQVEEKTQRQRGEREVD